MHEFGRMAPEKLANVRHRNLVFVGILLTEDYSIAGLKQEVIEKLANVLRGKRWALYDMETGTQLSTNLELQQACANKDLIKVIVRILYDGPKTQGSSSKPGGAGLKSAVPRRDLK